MKKKRWKRWTDRCENCGSKYSIDPATIPDQVIYSEVGRRRSAKRVTHAGGPGRPPVMRACPKCGVLLSATAMRKHRCPGGA